MGEPWKIETVVEALPVGTKVRHWPGHHRAGSYGQTHAPHFVNEDGVGVVVDHIRGYPEHACPDHDEGEDVCVCGDESGIVTESEATAVVAWEASYRDGSEAPPIRRCIRLSERSIVWDVEPVPIDRIDGRGDIREHLVGVAGRTLCGRPIVAAQEPAGAPRCKRCRSLAARLDTKRISGRVCPGCLGSCRHSLTNEACDRYDGEGRIHV